MNPGQASGRDTTILSTVAHELNNELQVVLARVELMSLDAGCASQAARLRTDIGRLSALVRDYLTYGELHQRPLCLDVQPTPLGPLLAEIQEEAALALGEAPVVECVFGLSTLTDRRRLHQALWNLVRNAVRHGKPPVTITATEHGGTVTIGIGDCGGGFAPGMTQARLHGRFSVNGGSGIGLWLASAIVEGHGGRIWLGRATCGGAHVGVSLPSARGCSAVHAGWTQQHTDTRAASGVGDVCVGREL